MAHKIAVIGTGLVGQGWAIVFARAGCQAALFDADAGALKTALANMQHSLVELRSAALLQDAPEDVLARVAATTRLDAALEGACYVQESIFEDVEAKRAVFRQLDAGSSQDAILASSSSGIAASAFTSELAGRHRCLVVHPLNPPYLIPLVELAPSPWTAPEVVERSKTLLSSVGQSPVVVRREIPGFVSNRLQGALLNEALRLVEGGYASAEDIDKAVSHGLGLRWSFMGPFETIDLNAPEGIADYARRYGPMYRAMLHFWRASDPWAADVLESVEAERRSALPKAQLGARRRWRDRCLMALAQLRANAAGEKEESDG